MIIVYAGTRNLYRKMLPSIRSLLAHNDVERIIILAEDDAFYAPALLRSAQAPAAPGWNPEDSPGLVAPDGSVKGATAIPEDIRLPEICEVRNVLPLRDRYFRPNGPNIRNKFTWMAMMRALYPDLFPDLDRVIQLDVDTIICDDLTPVWEADLRRMWFAAVPEHLGTHRPYGPKYYNIGVAVFNLEQMRRDFATVRLVGRLNEVKCPYVDQDALNMYASAFGVDLPVRYNETFVTGYTDDPAIVHFAGIPDWWCNENAKRHEYLERWKRPEDYGPEFTEV